MGYARTKCPHYFVCQSDVPDSSDLLGVVSGVSYSSQRIGNVTAVSKGYLLYNFCFPLMIKHFSESLRQLKLIEGF